MTIVCSPLKVFQFALPRGERRVASALSSVGGSFQFALPRGERRMQMRSSKKYIPFQFALPRGERLPSSDGRYCLA